MILFRPPKPYAIRRIANRTHRRLLIADGEVGMTGGVGIAAEWTGDAEGPDHWRDTHVRVRGPVVRGMQGAFAENWLEGTGEVLAGEGYLPELEPVEGGGPMQLVRSSATVGDTNAEALYYLAIASARESIELTAAYFVPGRRSPRRSAQPPSAGVEVRDPGPGPAHRQGLRPRGGTSGLRRAARGRRSAVRVPADDAAREVARASTVPGRRSGRSTSTTARSSSTTRSRSASGTSASRASSRKPSSVTSSAPRRSTPVAGAAAALLQRASEAATTVLRREL